jgi:hypothetical protein
VKGDRLKGETLQKRRKVGKFMVLSEVRTNFESSGKFRDEYGSSGQQLQSVMNTINCALERLNIMKVSS